jgi:hypothetical protein
MTGTKNTLKRQRHPMPDFIRHALEERKLMVDYLARPPISKMIIQAGYNVAPWNVPAKNVPHKCWMNWNQVAFI